MKCPNCGEYFVDGEDRCPTCDQPLTAAARLKLASPPRVQGYSRRLITVLVGIFLAGCILGLIHSVFTSQVDKREWKSYHSNDGHFSVRLPNEPDTRETVLTFADDSMATRYSLISTTETCTYYVEYIEYADDLQHATDVVPRLIQMKKDELSKSKGKLVSEKRSRYLGYPGAYFVYNLPWVQVREHMLAKGNRVYSVHADYLPSKAEKYKISFFFSSVHITDD